MHLLLAFNNILITVKGSSLTFVFYKAGCHANPVAERNFSGSSSYNLRHIFLKFSNTSAVNNALL